MEASSERFLIVQLGDIHLRERGNAAGERIADIAKAVANVEVDLRAAVIALSGDIAYSGGREEYGVAKAYLAKLREELEAKLRGVPVYILGIPGNHDCRFKDEKSARPILIESMVKDPGRALEQDVFAQCTQVQANFFSFLDEVQSPCRVRNVANAYYEYEVAVGASVVLFRCYNTAMGSTLHEKPGALAVPNSLLTTEATATACGYAVSIFHHPYNWLSQFNIRTFRKHIDATSDLILTGHEHDSDNYAKYTRRGESMMYLEGPAFQEDGSGDYSGFNAIWVDLTAQQHKIITFGWNESLFEATTANPKWLPFHRSSRLIARDFQLSDAMDRDLDDPGAKFVHGAKTQIALNDIYVFPDARALVREGKKGTLREENVESKDLLKFISNKRRLLIVGRERAGKSSLAKVLFRDTYEKGYVPVLLRGEEITSMEREKFEELVERQLLYQYNNPNLPAFKQLDRDQTVIIIDDFDHVRFASRGRQRILSNIHKRFERVVIFNDDSIRLEEVADAEFAAAVLSEYTQIELKDFGYFLRSKLIEKWCRLGAEYVMAEQDLECKITRYEGLIDSALRKSYLPSVPFFILIFVQSLDASQPVGASAGSYGYLCELLITRNLATAHKAASLNTKETYLAELAYCLFTKRAKELSQEEFVAFHEGHCRKYNLGLDREAVFQELVESALVARSEGRYRFKYPYYHYYFIARFMRDHLNEPDVLQEAKALCEKLHIEDNANIWLFLSHHSKNPVLVDLILYRRA